MSLRTKIVLLLTALLVVFVAAGEAIQRRFVLPRFDEVERAGALTDMVRLQEALDREQAMLQVLAADWGNWGEMYRAMRTPDPKFIAENTAPASMKGPNLNLLAFIEPDGRYTFRRGYAPGSGGELEFAAFGVDRLPASHPWRRAIREGRSAHGLLLTEHGPLLAAIGPILDGNGGGPARGAVLMGRLLTTAELRRLSEQARVDAHLVLPSELAMVTGPHHGPGPALIRRPDVNDVYLPLRDLTGHEAIGLEITVPRRISAEGHDAVRVAQSMLIVSGLLTLLVQLGLLRWLVLRPLERITLQAVAAGHGNDLTGRIGLRRGDELGVLATEFDRMMDRLLQARMEMADATYRAGVAEMAGGVLHNVGNALTPIGVQAGGLRQRLAAVPLAELRLALAELAADGGDPVRRADLQAFVELVAHELSAVADAAGTSADAIAQQVHAIHQLLESHTSSTHTAGVIERVQLGAVIEQALALVPVDRRDHIVIAVDASVRETGAVPIPRITIVQAFQNVIQNACEAMPVGRRGTLVIHAATHVAGDATELRVAFTDDGTGVAPENASRVFTKGFSTKPGTRNSGVGLHWTANALNAVGGRIELASPGPGQGATVTVVVPLPSDAHARMENAA